LVILVKPFKTHIEYRKKSGRVTYIF